MDSIHFNKLNRKQVPWSDLPPELLLKIVECLGSRPDVQNFRAVCKAWQRSTPLSVLASKNILSPIFPYSLGTFTRWWLDGSGGGSPVLVASYVFLFQSTFDPKLPPWLFSAEELHPGKLFVSHDLSPIVIKKLPYCFPRNLELSNVQVNQLAAFHRLRFADDPNDMFRNESFTSFNENRVVLFVKPNCSKTNPAIGDCTAIVLHHRGALCAIRLKNKRKFHVCFRESHVEVKKFDDIVNFKDKIYAIDRKGRAYTMDYKTLSLLLVIGKPLLQLPNKKMRLAVSSDHQELYLIHRWCRRGTRGEIGFSIYKLNEEEKIWDEVKGFGDDEILFVTFDGSFFASAKDFQGWKGNCIVFYKGCFASYEHNGMGSLQDRDEFLYVYNLEADDGCQLLDSYESAVLHLRPPPTWLLSNECMPKWATKEDQVTQSDAGSQDGESPTSAELDPVVEERFVEAPSDSVARGSISRHDAPSSSFLVQELADEAMEMPSTSATQERLTRTEMPSSAMSALEVAEPITERVTRTSAMNELEHAAEEVSRLKNLIGESKSTHHVSKNYLTSQSNNNDYSTAKFEGLDIRSNLIQTLQNIWSKHGNLIENSIIRNGDVVSRALESLATAVLILEETSVQSLSDSQADYLNITLSDLQCMNFKVGWLVPYVEKAVKLHKSKPLMDSRDELLRRQAKVVERRSRLNEELAELNDLEKALAEEVANVSTSIPYSGMVDMNQPVGWGFS